MAHRMEVRYVSICMYMSKCTRVCVLEFSGNHRHADHASVLRGVRVDEHDMQAFPGEKRGESQYANLHMLCQRSSCLSDFLCPFFDSIDRLHVLRQPWHAKDARGTPGDRARWLLTYTRVYILVYSVTCRLSKYLLEGILPMPVWYSNMLMVRIRSCRRWLSLCNPTPHSGHIASYAWNAFMKILVRSRTALATCSLKSGGRVFRRRARAPSSSIWKLPQPCFARMPGIRAKSSRHIGFYTYMSGEFSNAVAGEARCLC